MTLTVGAVANTRAVTNKDGEEEDVDNVLSTAGARKAADFVKFCDAFEIPVLTLVDVKGFKASKHEENTIARACAALTAAFAGANVAKVTVVTGEAYGSAYLAMNSKHIGSDMVFAYPDAKIGMMNAQSAVKIMYADEIAASGNGAAVVAEKAAEYDALQTSPYAAARHGYVDDIIEPAATRKRVIAAFEMLADKDEYRGLSKKHGTI